MNPKRQIVEQAIMDLEENRERVSQIYKEWAKLGQNPDPDYYKKVEELGVEMEKTRRERKNIAARLFDDYVTSNGKPNSEPNYKYYDPKPTPVFSVGDFHRKPGLPRSYPMITGVATRPPSDGNKTLKKIDKFIKQLKYKMETRKDFQENKSFQLTETKLKQMIVEAIKDKRFQDFGIPTPDDELRANLGDEMFDKILAQDPEQAEIFKQSYDPNYPRSIEQESLNAILEPAGFKLYTFKYNRPVLHKRYNSRTWTKKDSVNYDSLKFYTEYNVFSGLLRYTVGIKTEKGRSKQNVTIATGKIKTPKYFELSLETEEKLRDADALVLSREKQAIEEALEQYK